jgi:photosystem II stability/assembly factor-like uncharacterized protein
MSQAFAIWHTTDGAATWNRIYQSDLTRDAMCKVAIHFADTLRGWVTLSSPNSSAVFDRTVDGGKTWTSSTPLPNPPSFVATGGGYVLSAGRVQSFGPILFASAIGGGAGNFEIYAFQSRDGGSSWSYVSTAPERMVPIVFLTSARWIQMAPPVSTQETTDGGASWHRYTTDYAQSAPEAVTMVFADPVVGYAIVAGGLGRTVDGGAHWSFIPAPRS